MAQFPPVHEGVAQFWPGRNPLGNLPPAPFLPPAFPPAPLQPPTPVAPPNPPTIPEPSTSALTVPQSEPTPPPLTIKPFKTQTRTSRKRIPKQWQPKDFLTIHISHGLPSTIAINFENTTTGLDEDRDYTLSEEEQTYPPDEQLIAGLIFALTEITTTNIALITVKMPLNPQIYIEQLTEQQDRHRNWLELIKQYKFQILTARHYDKTPQQRYYNERKRVFVVAPRKLKYNPTTQQLYDEFSNHGTVDHIRPAQSRDGTLSCIYVRFAYEQSAMQMVRNGTLGAQFADPFSFSDPTYNPYMICPSCNLEIEKAHREYHNAICEMQRFDPGAFLPHEPPQEAM